MAADTLKTWQCNAQVSLMAVAFLSVCLSQVLVSGEKFPRPAVVSGKLCDGVVSEFVNLFLTGGHCG